LPELAVVHEHAYTTSRTAVQANASRAFSARVAADDLKLAATHRAHGAAIAVVSVVVEAR
jgi:hypothetical protein